jgi:RNA polymerase sigma-70 factor (ECF subfamily)
VKSDAELVAGTLDGSPRDFDAIVERYSVDCLRYARRLLGRREDAEDAVQETFIATYRALGRYREQESFRPWLFRILVNQCRTLARQRGRLEQRVVRDEVAIDRAAGPAHDGAADLADALQVALSAIEPLQREAFLLRHGLGLDYVEMSRVTGAGVSALKMRVKRAGDALRPRLEAMLDE